MATTMRARVLLVEDSAPSRELMACFLGALGVEVWQASNGAEAVAAFETERFALVLTDVSMPVMGGLEAATRMRELESQRALPTTPIVALTAGSRADELAGCIRAGCEDVLTKPVSQQDLACLLRQHGVRTEG